jgi:hypothetical protein
MMNEMFFDPTKVIETSNDKYAILPDGIYIATIDGVQVKEPDASKKGAMVYFKIAHGKYADKRVVDYFNIKHPNPDAQRIGQSKFKDMLKCIGFHEKPLKSESDIENQLIKIEVTHKDHYKYKDQQQNNVKKYYPLNITDLNLMNNISKPKQIELDMSSPEIPF